MGNLNTTKMSREEWLEVRRTGIGGSDIGVILGINPFKTPYQLWLDKTGRDQSAPSTEAQERMDWGTKLEAVIAQEYAERTLQKVQRVNTMMRDGNCLANIDRAVVAEGTRARYNGQALLGAERLLEVKTAHALAASRGDEWGAMGTDEVPPSYWTQCQWYMGISKVPVCDLAVLFGGQVMKIYTIDYNRELFINMVETATAWWNRHVVEDIPPDPNSSAECREIWRRGGGNSVEVSTEIAEVVADIKRLESETKDLEAIIDLRKAALLTAMGEADTATHQGQVIATWKKNRDSSKFNTKQFQQDNPELYEAYSVPTTGARVLRLSK